MAITTRQFWSSMGIAAMLLLGYGAGQMAPETALDGLMAFNRGDFSKAHAIWSRLAAKENGQALYNLGRMYEIGAGVKQDFEKAADLYRRAALKANPYALGHLGVLYATGHGVEQDLVRSYIHSSLAARHYSVWANDLRDMALRNRDLVASRMTEDQLKNARDQLSYP